jgi:hypothetical protein
LRAAELALDLRTVWGEPAGPVGGERADELAVAVEGDDEPVVGSVVLPHLARVG